MKGERILYPCYFDEALGRGQGRKVPLRNAIRTPGLTDIETALKKGGVKYRTEAKSHPAHWAGREGRIIAVWNKPKGELLKLVSSKLEVKRDVKHDLKRESKHDQKHDQKHDLKHDVKHDIRHEVKK